MVGMAAAVVMATVAMAVVAMVVVAVAMSEVVMAMSRWWCDAYASHVMGVINDEMNG